MQTLGLSPEPRRSNRIRELFWPEITDEVSALSAARNGMYVSFAIAGLIAIGSLFGPNTSGGLIFAALYVMIGVGIRQLSRTAAVSGLTMYLLAQMAAILADPPNFPIGGLILPVILTAALAASVRAAFLAHRLRPESALGEVANPEMRIDSAARQMLETLPSRLWPRIRLPFLVVMCLLIQLMLMQWCALVFVQHYVLPTGSMEPTLLSGDRLIMLRRLYAGEFHRGDLIVFQYPPDHRQTLTKRIIGMPGDRVRISSKKLLLNGKPVLEPYVQHSTDYIDLYRDNFPGTGAFPELGKEFLKDGARRLLKEHVERGDVRVPPRCYFVLGDNRDMSFDSRYWGFVAEEEIKGRPILIYSSIGEGGAERSGRAPFWINRYLLLPGDEDESTEEQASNRLVKHWAHLR